jgi:hypothetical protein
MTLPKLVTALVGAAALLAGCAASESGQRPQAAHPAVQLVFNEQGEAALPKGYRSWVHVFTAWEPITTSILDEQTTGTPEFHNLYVEPTAYRAFMETGRWPEGTLMVKEFSFTSTDKDNCDGPPAYICGVWFGKGIFQHGFTGVGVMLKDSKRYPNEAGGWAYFSYGHRQPPYAAYSLLMPRRRCAQCHIDHAGADQDYVFSINQPGLSREGDDIANNLAASLPD